MNYTSFAHIKTIDDVKRFFHHLTSERKLSFHPDDDFSDYVFFPMVSLHLQQMRLKCIID